MLDPSKSVRVLVLVCTYNEQKNLPALVEEIFAVAPNAHIFVVDDGSPDGTGDWAAEESTHRPNLNVLQRGAKLGLGTAIKAGLLYAIENEYDFVINLDADFSHDPACIPKILEAAINRQASLVIGSRYVAGGGFRNCSWRRHLVSRIANLYARGIVGWNVRDCSSAYRCYKVNELRKLDFSKIECVGYGFLEEILWAILRTGGSVIESPIIYTERELGESKISLKEAIGTLKVLHRLALKRFTHSP